MLYPWEDSPGPGQEDIFKESVDPHLDPAPREPSDAPVTAVSPPRGASNPEEEGAPPKVSRLKIPLFVDRSSVSTVFSQVLFEYTCNTQVLLK